MKIIVIYSFFDEFFSLSLLNSYIMEYLNKQINIFKNKKIKNKHKYFKKNIISLIQKMNFFCFFKIK